MDTTDFSLPTRLSTPLAITNVTLIPMDRERLVPGQTVVIEGGFITAIDDWGNIDISGMQVVDGAGRYLLPGLADMHVHYWSPGEFALFLAYGVTLVRNMSGAPFHLALQGKIESGNLPGPRIVSTSPIIEGPGYTLPMWQSLDDPQLASGLVNALLDRGYSQIKVLNQLTPDVLQALGQAARARAVHMTGHCPEAITFEAAIDSGMTCFEHLVGIWRGHMKAGIDLPALPNLALEVIERAAYQVDYVAIRRLAQRMASQDIWNCPTLVAMQYMYEPQVDGLANPLLQPWLRYVPEVALDLWAELDPSARFANRPYSYERWQAAIHDRTRAFSAIITILHEEGAPLLVGTDTSVRFVIQGLSVHQELANFVAAGLSPFEALRCATTEAARFLGQDSQWGTVTVGKRSDLILTRASPLQDLSALREPEAVFVNGYYLQRTDLVHLLDQQAMLARQPSLESLPGTQLGGAYQAGDVLRLGSLVEHAGDKERGWLSYRHHSLSGGGWLLQETQAYEQGSIFSPGGARQRTTELRLNDDYTLRKASVVEHSFAGAAQTEIEWSEMNSYKVLRVDEDHHEAQSTFSDQLLLPDISLGITTLAFLLAHWQPSQCKAIHPACHLDEGGASAVNLQIAALDEARPDQADTTARWRVSLEGTYLSQEIELSSTGAIRRITSGDSTFTPV